MTPIYPELRDLFARQGYLIEVSGVEKVLVMPASQLPYYAALQAEAQARGYAFMSLNALYNAPGVRVPFNVVALMTGATPFGPFMSLDGLHPSAAGQTLIAQAAAQALNARYDLGIPIP